MKYDSEFLKNNSVIERSLSGNSGTNGVLKDETFDGICEGSTFSTFACAIVSVS